MTERLKHRVKKLEEKPKRFLLDLKSMDAEVRRMAHLEDRSLTAQVRRLVRIALNKLAEDEEKKK